MDVDVAFPILSIIVPFILAFALRSKIRAIVWGTVWIWFLMITASQYHLAYDPEYDSIAPGLAIVAGWLPGLIYSSLCTVAAIAVTVIRSRITKQSP
jgi:hypothetical protein